MCLFWKTKYKLRKMEIYDPEVVKTFSMPPKLWRYMRSDIRD